MEKKKKVTVTDCVKEAKEIVKLLRLKNAHRAKVADLAIKACTIKHGGRAPLTRVTLKFFADKIGIEHKTLYEWVRTRRMIYEKLTAQQKTVYNELPYDALRHMNKELDLQTPVEETRKVFEKHAKASPIVTKLVKYERNLDTIIYNLCNFSRASEVPDDILLSYINKSKKIEKLSKKTMKFRGKEIPAKVTRPVIDWDSFWESEIGVVE